MTYILTKWIMKRADEPCGSWATESFDVLAEEGQLDRAIVSFYDALESEARGRGHEAVDAELCPGFSELACGFGGWVRCKVLTFEGDEDFTVLRLDEFFDVPTEDGWQGFPGRPDSLG